MMTHSPLSTVGSTQSAHSILTFFTNHCEQPIRERDNCSSSKNRQVYTNSLLAQQVKCLKVHILWLISCNIAQYLSILKPQGAPVDLSTLSIGKGVLRCKNGPQHLDAVRCQNKEDISVLPWYCRVLVVVVKGKYWESSRRKSLMSKKQNHFLPVSMRKYKSRYCSLYQRSIKH